MIAAASSEISGERGSYLYDYWGEVVPAPISYIPTRVITGFDLGIGALRNTQDVFVDSQSDVDILDSGNNRVVILDSSLEIQSVITALNNNGVDDRLNQPQGLFATDNGEIFIADTGNQKDAYSHFELESLPSGGWGYMHFPLTIRYARNLGLDCVAQTGKFHTSWGDFHSFKNKEALEFECFNMLAQNAKCMIGDQLEPNGVLSQPVYDLIGSVYSEVERKEPWCRGAKAVVDIGVFTPEEFYGADVGALPPALVGAARILQRTSHQFDVIDSQSDFSRYKVLIMPDDISVSDELAQKLEQYLANGGSIVASFESGMNREKTDFRLKALGVALKDEVTCTPDGVPVRGRVFAGNAYADYLLPKGEIAKGLPETEHVMYMKGVEVEAVSGSQVLSDVIPPYFNRTYEHFCSHRQAPSSGKRGYAGIVRNGNVIYFAHPIFRLYDRCAPRWCKKLIHNALDMLLTEPVLRHNGPCTMLTTVNEQVRENRWVVHLLHYVPERVSQTLDVIEDVIPLYNVKISVRIPSMMPESGVGNVRKVGKVSRVELVPAHQELPFAAVGERVEFTVPEIRGHQMVSVEF